MRHVPFCQKCACLLLFLFSAGLVDIPVWIIPGYVNPKTCCGRAICQCTHAKGELCPIKLKREGKQLAGHEAVKVPPAEGQKNTMPCHLKKTSEVQKVSEEGRTIIDQKIQDQKLPFYKNAPCHSEKAPASGPSALKEFVHKPAAFEHFFSGENVFPGSAVNYAFLFLSIPEPPPKILFS